MCGKNRLYCVLILLQNLKLDEIYVSCLDASKDSYCKTWHALQLIFRDKHMNSDRVLPMLVGFAGSSFSVGGCVLKFK